MAPPRATLVSGSIRALLGSTPVTSASISRTAGFLAALGSMWMWSDRLPYGFQDRDVRTPENCGWLLVYLGTNLKSVMLTPDSSTPVY